MSVLEPVGSATRDFHHGKPVEVKFFWGHEGILPRWRLTRGNRATVSGASGPAEVDAHLEPCSEWTRQDVSTTFARARLIAYEPKGATKMRPERQLRLVQLANILFVAVCFFVKRIGIVETHDTVTVRDWIVIVAAIWSAVSGFTGQRRINNASTRPQRSSRSTPMGRWKTGHFVRLSSATAVGLWGLVLHYFGGSEWLVNVLLGLAMLLLLIWRPGAAPVPAQPSESLKD